jgi:hypothetical protein
MDGMLIKPGTEVAFHNKVFQPPYTPFYDEYANQTFQVVRLHHDDTHVELVCISDPSIKVKGYVHDDEIVPTAPQQKISHWMK